MKREPAREQGFTLIEMIVVLVLLAMLTAFAGMGIVSATTGFFLAKTNAETVQKAQIAITRLTKEFALISAVSSGTSTAISFTSTRGATLANHTVALAGNNLLLNGDLLTDDVAQFELAYYDAFDGTASSTWSSSTVLIEVTLTLTGANNTTSSYTNRVTPRNL